MDQSFHCHATREVYGAKVKLSLAQWTGLSVPLEWSVLAVSLGTGLFLPQYRSKRCKCGLTSEENLG